jgi:hypothetical protein
MKKYYAGIGSRETPEALRPTIERIVKFLHQEGYTLRSGGARGADEMFETGLRNLFYDEEQWGVWTQYKEIYVPWYCFQSSTSPLCRVSDEAIELSLQYHPNPTALKDSVRKIMGRNAYQVLGQDLKTKSDFIVCWTQDGGASGGTGQAMRIAAAYGIKVFNLKNRTDFEQWYSDNNFDIM